MVAVSEGRPRILGNRGNDARRVANDRQLMRPQLLDVIGPKDDIGVDPGNLIDDVAKGFEAVEGG
jgi:hypothetical protein